MSAKTRQSSTSAKTVQTLQRTGNDDLSKPGKKVADPIATMLLPSWKHRPAFREQVMRLASMDFFPSLDEGVRELLNALIRVSGGDIEKATRICNDAIRLGRPNQEKAHEQRKCPTPMDLEQIANGVVTFDSVPKGCEKCEGTGLRYTTRKFSFMATDKDGKPFERDSYEADCQELCDCDLGRFLKAREVERKQMERTA